MLEYWMKNDQVEVYVEVENFSGLALTFYFPIIPFFHHSTIP
jgi:hypothetical protein